ncbi:MAG: AarF/UbiB family protein, partial [Myxococcota bacterium]
FGRLHQDRPDIVIPTVYDDLSSATVLTLSYIEGCPFSRLPADLNRAALAERIVREAFDQVFIDGVYHADPHPGNLLYLPDGRFGILDFGVVGRLTPQMQETLIVLAIAVSVRDADTVARTMYRLGQGGERVSLSDIRDDTVVVLDRYLDRSLSDIDSGLLLQDILTLGMKHQLRIPPEYTMLGRAATTIEGIVRDLDAHIDVAQVVRPHAERLLLSRVAPEQVESGLYRALLQFQGLSADVPLQASQILSDLSSGNTQVRVYGPSLEKLQAAVLIAASLIAGSIIAGAFIVGSFIALSSIEGTLFGWPAIGVVGGVIGMTLASWVGAYALLRPRLRKLSLLRLFGTRASK